MNSNPTRKLPAAIGIVMATAFAAIAVLGGTITPAAAELPPQVYERMKKQAPEELVIRVSSVQSGRRGKSIRVLVTATIDSVIRTKTGLKKGATIRIAYETRTADDRRVGPRPIPVIGKGRYTAYLARQGDYYYPAARGASFAKR